MTGGGPLRKIRVLELGSMLAGPFVGTLLADFGAEVIKVEKPGKTDPLREWPPHKGETPLWWKTMARNKRLVTLDISMPQARAAVLRLIARSDVVIENFRPGTLERWQLAPNQLQGAFPRTVWVRVSGYGQNGPYSRQGGYATIAECFAGLAAITGFPDRGPMVSAFPLGDYLAGVFGAFGALIALRERDAGGHGQVVDVSLFEPFVRILESAVVRYDQTGQKKPRLGNEMEEDVPRNVYPTADGGYIAVSCGSQRIFENLMDAIGRRELKDDPRFASMAARVENRAAIDRTVADWMSRQPTGAALGTLNACGVVAGKVNDIGEVMRDPHVAARAAIVSVADDDLGSIRMPAPVPKLSSTPGEVRWAGGRPGADNAYVFGELLGLDGGAITELERQGVI
ncbi:MAG TPA: CaiB/BaiF CoA-transferase family protein [Stellaceae bacterium]|nr:CaiB/BaiF CoA-transferase family protein [Stellaceae bacterium]